MFRGKAKLCGSDLLRGGRDNLFYQHGKHIVIGANRLRKLQNPIQVKEAMLIRWLSLVLIKC